MQRLLIADASSLIFRGSAIKCTTDPVYNGGWSFLWRKIFNKIQELNPTHVCIAGDGYNSSQTRREILKDYKAHRPECPPLIKYQLANVYLLCNILNIRYASQELYEADDVIHTIVQQALKRNFDSVDIICDDKDLFTLLIDSRVAIHKLSKSAINPIRVRDSSKDVIPIKDFNVLPSQIPDFLALVGDAVDNIPGCPTIGTKRAQWLLNKYGNIDGIFSQLNDIEIKQKQKSMAKHLKQNEQKVRTGLTLIKLHDLTNKMDCGIDDTSFDINGLQIEQIQLELKEFGIETVCDDIETAKREISQRDIFHNNKFFTCNNKNMLL